MKKNTKTEILKRVKLLMNYDLSMTLNENVISNSFNSKKIQEQQTPTTNTTTVPSLYNYYLKNIKNKKQSDVENKKNQEQLNSIKRYVNSLKVDGPFTMDGVKFLNNTIIVEKNQIGEGYYTVTNNSNKNINIESVTSNSEPDKITVSALTGILKPKEVRKIYVSIYDKIPNKNNKDDYSQLIKPLSDKTRNVLPKQIILNKENYSNTITLNTDLYTQNIQVNFGYSSAQKSMDKIVSNSSKRISPKGYKVPEYFSVFEYDDFINELENNKCFPQESYDSIFGDVLQNARKGKPVSPEELLKRSKRGVFVGGDKKGTRNKWIECTNFYKKLYEKYHDQNFPNGIHSEEKQEFYEKVNQLNKKAREIENQFSQIKYNDYDERDELVRQSKAIDYQAKELYSEYGYDSRSTFDKFMDSGFGQIAQLGAFAFLMIAGFVTEGATWAMVAEMGLNVGLGTYYFARGNTRESLTWFIFAFMGELHTLYNSVSNAVVRKIANESVESISKGIAKALEGVSLSTKEELNAFMYTKLTKNQRIVFRETLNQIKNSNTKILEQSLEQYAKEIAQARGVWKDISWTSAMKLKPGSLKFVRNTVLDLAATIPLVEKLYDELKKQFKEHGIDITWGEKDKKILEELSEKQSQSEIRSTFNYMSKVASGLSEPEQAYYAEELNRIKNEKQLEDLKNKTDLDIKKKQEEIKKQLRDKTIENAELMKKYYTKGSPENMKLWEQLKEMSKKTGKITSNGIETLYHDISFLRILKNKQYKDGDIFEYFGDNPEIIKILDMDAFEDVPETEAKDRRPKKI